MSSKDKSDKKAASIARTTFNRNRVIVSKKSKEKNKRIKKKDLNPYWDDI